MPLSSLSHLLPLPRNYFKDTHTQTDLYSLQNYRCDNMQLTRLAAELQEKNGFASLAHLKQLNLCIISSGNNSFKLPAIIGTGVRYGFSLDITDISNTHPLQLTPKNNKQLQCKIFDIILITLNYDDFNYWYPDTKVAYNLHPNLEEIVHQLAQLRALLSEISNASIIFQNIPRKPVTTFGHNDALTSMSLQYQHQQFNQSISNMVKNTNSYLFDISSIAENEGLNRWHDERMWNIAKQPFSPQFIPLYAENFFHVVNAIKGKSRKCIVLDLDNTLWGGIVGEDGIEGISLSIGNPEGDAFLSFQQYLLHLKDRGIILAVCSKNNETDALDVFRNHPNMLLKLNDIACFKANWENKPNNISAIASTLNIGLDSIVFIDDSPLERDNVRRYLPSVAVPEMPIEPSEYVRTLSQAGYFGLSSFTTEDIVRNQSYQNKIKAEQVLSENIDLKQGLEAIEMKIKFLPFNAIGRNRIEQLINKSNQFNLTTRRYNSAQIKTFEDGENYYTLQVHLQDKFGDYGMISVLIGKIEGTQLTIDTWLMSCRAIGRNVEDAVFQHLVNFCMNKQITCIIGNYLKSERNSQVEYHYKQLGFKQLELEKNHSWHYSVNTMHREKLPFQILDD